MLIITNKKNIKQHYIPYWCIPSAANIRHGFITLEKKSDRSVWDVALKFVQRFCGD